MDNNLFSSAKEKLKGNGLAIAMLLSVVGAGAFSYYTITDINQKLSHQKLPEVTENSIVQQEEAKETQNDKQNVPLPSATPAPTATTKPVNNTAEDTKDKEESSSETTETQATDTSFKLPVDGEIYAVYSGDELVYNRTMDDWRTHNGIDISASKDAAVYAGTNGVVKAVYEDGLLGNVIEIDHGTFVAKYCGLNTKTFVKVDDKVQKGQTIGSIGEIPLEISDNPHLHLEIYVEGQRVNPETILG